MSQQTGTDWKPFLIWLLGNVVGFGALGIAILTISGLIARTGVYGTLLFISLPISFAQWIALRRILHVPALWIFTVPIGMLVVVFILRNLPDSMGESEATSTFIIGFMFIGAIIALPQWLILRRYFGNASLWVLGTALGSAAGMGVILGTDLINQSGTFAYITIVLLYTIVTGFVLVYLLAKNSPSPASATNPA